MNYKISIVLLLLAATQFFSVANAQNASSATKTSSKFENWYNEDLASDHKFGMSVDRTYNELLKGKKSASSRKQKIIKAGLKHFLLLIIILYSDQRGDWIMRNLVCLIRQTFIILQRTD